MLGPATQLAILAFLRVVDIAGIAVGTEVVVMEEEGDELVAVRSGQEEILLLVTCVLLFKLE